MQNPTFMGIELILEKESTVLSKYLMCAPTADFDFDDEGNIWVVGGSTFTKAVMVLGRDLQEVDCPVNLKSRPPWIKMIGDYVFFLSPREIETADRKSGRVIDKKELDHPMDGCFVFQGSIYAFYYSNDSLARISPDVPIQEGQRSDQRFCLESGVASNQERFFTFKYLHFEGIEASVYDSIQRPARRFVLDEWLHMRGKNTHVNRYWKYAVDIKGRIFCYNTYPSLDPDDRSYNGLPHPTSNIWALNPDGKLSWITDATMEIRKIAVSPDGRLLVMGMRSPFSPENGFLQNADATLDYLSSGTGLECRFRIYNIRERE